MVVVVVVARRLRHDCLPGWLGEVGWRRAELGKAGEGEARRAGQERVWAGLAETRLGRGEARQGWRRW